MSLSPRAALLAGGAVMVVVVLAIVVVFALRSQPVEVAVEPSGTSPPTTSPTQAAATTSPASTATATPEPTEAATPTDRPSPDGDEIDAIFAEIDTQIEGIRGLAAEGIDPADLISRAELQRHFAEEFESDYTQPERDADNVTLRALGLLDPDEDIAELQLALLGGQVIGFYDDQEQRMAVVTDAGLTYEALETYAHEYTHALQDATFGLASLDIDAEGDDDGATARLSLVEGDAMLTEDLWEANHIEQFEPFLSFGSDGGSNGDSGTPDDEVEIPDFLWESLGFPYTFGYAFVIELHSAGGFAAVDAAFADPPESTEQVIHPELFFADHQPIPIELPDLAANLGSGWEQVESTPQGEAGIRIILDDLGAEYDPATAAAAGWGGDQLVVAAGPDDSFALAWRSAWDTPGDAAEFASVYRGVIPALPFPAEVVELADGSVLVAHASTEELVQSVIGIASQ